MAFLILCALLAQASPPPPPRLEDGIRQVEQGDFEAAVATLRAAAAAIAGDPTRSVERARAYLFLGVAYLALDQSADAHRSFISALRDDPRLRLTDERFSPKVVAAFEAARREVRGAGGGGGSKGKIVVAAAAGAAVAAGAAIALGGSSGPLRVANARFATPAIVCPDDSNALPITYAVLADVTNEGDAATVLSATVMARIEVSTEAEVGFTSSRPVMINPSSIPAQRTTTLRLESTLLCSNGAGGPPRSNAWSAHLTVTTTAGTIAAQTPPSPSDFMTVSIP